MKQIEIKTAHNVTIEYELASLWERMLSMIIDLICFLILYIAMYTLAEFLFPYSLASSRFGGFIMGFLYIFGFLGYHFMFEIFANGQSLGKLALGLKVVRIDGREAGLSEYMLRSVFLIVDFLVSMGILGALFISSSIKNQRLGDMTANTTVIKLRTAHRFRLADILNISTIEKHKPQYPQVKYWPETDMLLIKEVLNRGRLYKNKAHQEAIDLLVERLSKELNVTVPPNQKLTFLKTLIRDYIVLTR